MSPVFILHGRHDRIIPCGEAKRLAQRFNRQKLPYFLCVSELLTHGNSEISMRKFFEVYRLLKGFAWFLGQIGRAR
jgi:predicted esterase